MNVQVAETTISQQFFIFIENGGRNGNKMISFGINNLSNYLKSLKAAFKISPHSF